MLRLVLPPNLAAAAVRDAIAVQMDLDLGAPPRAALLPGLALLSQWAGAGAATPKAPATRLFLQLSRRQLRELVGSLKGEPVFFWTRTPDLPIVWDGARLSGVSECLMSSEHRPASEGAAASRGFPAAPSSDPAPMKRMAAARTPSSTGPCVDGSEHFLSIELPSREDPGYGEVLALLKGAGFVLEPSNRKWWLRDRHRTLAFLAAHRRMLRERYGARFTANFEKNTQRLHEPEVVCAAAVAVGGFEVTIGFEEGAGGAAVREAVASGRPYVESGDKVFLLDPERVRRVASAQRALDPGQTATGGQRRTLRIPTVRTAEVEEVLNELSPAFKPPDEWRRHTDGLRQHSKLEPVPIDAAFASRLRPYQRLGAAWLWHLHRLGLGGILADEMGLGKTLQALALLEAVAKTGPKPSLVVCPASLVENWRREAERFTPSLRVFVHHGDRRLPTAAAFAHYDCVITSYGTLARDLERFPEVSFACVVGDEAQHIKNRRSQNAAALRSLRADSRILLTGTPLENSLDDLRSLFDFLLPGYLERVPAGAGTDQKAWHDGRLRAQTAPYILRRTKKSVAPELPEKIEQTRWCQFEPDQERLYRDEQERSERELFDLEASGAGEGRLRFAALTQLLRLRQICCDPRLVRGEAGSAKLDALVEIVSEAVDDGHRLLVFSQFTSLLALLRPELEALDLEHCYLDGSMSPAARQDEVDRFQNSQIPVFLLSLKAGGVGLNLTGADTVVHFDPWWNPAVEAQATDRAHRIGQTRVVTSYKLVCSGTVEERVLALQEEKRALLAGVFEASDEASARLSLGDLKTLLGGRA